MSFHAHHAILLGHELGMPDSIFACGGAIAEAG